MSASLLTMGNALATATAQPHARRKAWSFSASPILTTLNGDSRNRARAAESPLALLTPTGGAMTAPLLKMICSSRPRSRMIFRTMFSSGSQVAKMLRPTDSGVT